MKSYDFLVLGQGLAGTVLALQFMERGKSVLVIDNSHKSSSSVVAAGMWNPIVFRKLNKSWRVDELMPEMDVFYSRWEKQFEASFFHYKDIARIFPGHEQQNDWIARSAEQGYMQYLAEEEGKDLPGVKLRMPSGYGLVRKSGWLNVPLFLEKARNYFEGKESILTDEFDYSLLEIHPDGVKYKEVSATQLVFCEGFKGAENPWFNWLSFGNTKGELVTIKSEGLSEELIPNLGVWALPVGDQLHKVGATFDWSDMTLEATETARKKLIHELEQLINVPYEIIRQQAGIRPTTQDRRPMVGVHPAHSSLAVFNGLGTKGVMNAPWTAKQLCEHLLDGVALEKDIDCRRFLK